MKLVIWGTGTCATSYLNILDPDQEVVALVDNNARLHGTVFDGITVCAPKVLTDINYDFLVIASTYDDVIREQIEAERLAPLQKVLSVHGNPIRSSQFTTKPHRSCTCPPEVIRRMENRRWYHAIEIQPGCFTPGPVQPRSIFMDYPQVEDLTGKKVLDVGAWDGGYTILAERRGASVTALDIQDPDHSGFNIVKELTDSKANHILGSVYDLNPAQHGTFDVVLFFGVFYHLFDPMRAFCNINRVLRPNGFMLFEGAILDHAYHIDETWRGMRDKMELYTSVPLTYYTSKSYWNDWSTWFVPNMCCLKEWIASAGFEVLYTNVIENISRGYGLARKISMPLREHEVLQERSNHPICQTG